ncbi:hypothetical protein [Xanthomonas translucens]|uniref:hypothetical protein n=1 Tax=Xanthomonas campestris pv. translucens TaxID=343 RepID=UPI00210F22A5|nr:hypothetical protein [Xanthomonas translucens]
MPATWISNVAWPTMVMCRRSCRGAGTLGFTGTCAGQRAVPMAAFQRTTFPSELSMVGWPGLKKRTPSKWSLTGPL